MLGLITFVVSLLWIMAEPFLAPTTDTTEDLSGSMVVRASMLFVIGLTSITALILGLVALRQRSGRARAGIAIGIAMFAPLSTTFSFAASFFR
ncbi:hypothetical protein D3248_01770 [Leucobacter zeae]|nr:hypothetical protein [Leucobacter zeae]